jgi:hypothetical protein
MVPPPYFAPKRSTLTEVVVLLTIALSRENLLVSPGSIPPLLSLGKIRRPSSRRKKALLVLVSAYHKQ